MRSIPAWVLQTLAPGLAKPSKGDLCARYKLCQLHSSLTYRVYRGGADQVLNEYRS